MSIGRLLVFVVPARRAIDARVCRKQMLGLRVQGRDIAAAKIDKADLGVIRHAKLLDILLELPPSVGASLLSHGLDLRHLWGPHILGVEQFTRRPAAFIGDAASSRRLQDRTLHPVWEHNPFTFPKPVAPKRQPSVLNKLFLVSWLKDGDQVVVFVQHSETNQVQKIIAEFNQNNLRLIEIHLDPNPKLVAVVRREQRHTVRSRA